MGLNASVTDGVTRFRREADSATNLVVAVAVVIRLKEGRSIATVYKGMATRRR